MPPREKAARWLLLTNLVLSCYSAGAVWLVQITCYPLWEYVGPGEFVAYHEFWWHSIWGVLLGPAALVFLCALALLRWRPAVVSQRLAWAGVILQILLYGLTVALWGRWMAELEQVTGPVYGPLFHKMLLTHWLRVGLITAYALLALRMVVPLLLAGAGAEHAAGAAGGPLCPGSGSR
jgi:hypothetical protein